MKHCPVQDFDGRHTRGVPELKPVLLVSVFFTENELVHVMVPGELVQQVLVQRSSQVGLEDDHHYVFLALTAAA